MLVKQLNIRGVCRCHVSINLFWLRKILISLFVTKQYQQLWKDRRWCPDEAPMFWSPTWYWSRPMLFEKVEKRRIITFYFKTSTVDVGECIQRQQHWSKQHSKVVPPQERLLSIIKVFAKVFCRLYHLPMKQQIFKVFYYLPLTCFTTFFLF